MTTSTRPASTAAAQHMVIADWHPKSSPNNQKRHWRTVQQNHHHDRDVAWVNAKHAGWVFVSGKVRLTITLVYPRKYRVDADNLAARCKGVIDGLKKREVVMSGCKNITAHAGFFYDDSTEWLDLVVRAEVRPRQKATEIWLEPLP